MTRITSRAYARIGLLGNPSDAYFGKTIALAVENYYAEVTLEPSTAVRFVPHPVHDCLEFPSLAHLSERIKNNGYYGGIRLLWATCHQFSEYWRLKGTPLEDKPFTISYETNIPKQAHFNRFIPKEVRPNVVLDAERELGITAGLMDRVIQTYEGVVAMARGQHSPACARLAASPPRLAADSPDGAEPFRLVDLTALALRAYNHRLAQDFDQEHLKTKGYGVYTQLDPETLPKLWLIWGDSPGDSGKVHAPVRKLWDEGDPRTRGLVGECAELVPKGLKALEKGDFKAFADLMDRNFDIRRALFGDAGLGKPNIHMVEVARSCGAACKFTGSGGAVVALCRDDAQEVALAEACKANNLYCEEVRVHRASSAGT